MTITSFTPLTSFFGGCLIGFSALVLMAVSGRIAGITGILRGVFAHQRGDFGWRIAFVAGMFVAPLLLVKAGMSIPVVIPISLGAVVIGGILVGIGTSLGAGCTSGHGVCGLARFSLRSLVAVLTFMATAIVTVMVIRHGLGGV